MEIAVVFTTAISRLTTEMPQTGFLFDHLMGTPFQAECPPFVLFPTDFENTFCQNTGAEKIFRPQYFSVHIHLSNSQNRISLTAAWTRVVYPRSASVSVPGLLITPAPQAHCMVGAVSSSGAQVDAVQLSDCRIVLFGGD